MCHWKACAESWLVVLDVAGWLNFNGPVCTVVAYFGGKKYSILSNKTKYIEQ
jgi:hypothetical protein